MTSFVRLDNICLPAAFASNQTIHNNVSVCSLIDCSGLNKSSNSGRNGGDSSPSGPGQAPANSAGAQRTNLIGRNSQLLLTCQNERQLGLRWPTEFCLPSSHAPLLTINFQVWFLSLPLELNPTNISDPSPRRDDCPCGISFHKSAELSKYCKIDS